jgi:hypothetical protein
MGRTVLYYDRSKCPLSLQHDDEMASRRILFFALQTAMVNETARKNDDGFVLLVNMSNPFAAFDLDIARHSMPIKVASIHLICSQPGGAKSLHPSLKTGAFKLERLLVKMTTCATLPS